MIVTMVNIYTMMSGLCGVCVCEPVCMVSRPMVVNIKFLALTFSFLWISIASALVLTYTTF